MQVNVIHRTYPGAKVAGISQVFGIHGWQDVDYTQNLDTVLLNLNRELVTAVQLILDTDGGRVYPDYKLYEII